MCVYVFEPNVKMIEQNKRANLFHSGKINTDSLLAKLYAIHGIWLPQWNHWTNVGMTTSQWIVPVLFVALIWIDLLSMMKFIYFLYSFALAFRFLFDRFHLLSIFSFFVFCQLYVHWITNFVIAFFKTPLLNYNIYNWTFCHAYREFQ